MVVLLIYITVDTCIQLFVLHRNPGLPIIVWFLIAGNLVNALLINSGNRKYKEK